MVNAVATAWGFKTETTFGTPVVVDKWYPFDSENIVETREYLETPNTRGRVYPGEGTHVLGKEITSGDMNFWVDPESIGQHLFYTMGTAATPTQPNGTGAPNTWEHVLSLNTKTLKFFTSEYQYGDTTKAKKLTSAMSTGLGIEFAEASPASGTLGVIAQKMDPTVTSTTITFQDTLPRIMNFRDLSATVAGTSLTQLAGGSLQMSNDITEDFRAGNVNTQSLSAALFDIGGTLDVVYDSSVSTFDTWFEGTAASDLVIKLEGDLIESTYKYMVEVTVPRAVVTASTPVQANNDRIMRSVEWRGFYKWDGAAPNGVQVKLRNKKATTAYA